MLHSAGFLALVDDARSRINEIDIETYLDMQKTDESLVLIDVREQDEWKSGHLPNAIYLGKGIVERDIEVKFPDKQTKLVLYCGGGFRSALVADNLQKMGYAQVINMDGGFRRWCSLGLPLEKS